MRYCLFVISFLLAVVSSAQETTSHHQETKVAVRDTVVLDNAGINPKRFRISDAEGNTPSPFSYRIDYKKGTIYFSEELQKEHDSLSVEYFRYPSFLTREYFLMDRSEEHTSELQSRPHLVCRLLLEKKK